MIKYYVSNNWSLSVLKGNEYVLVSTKLTLAQETFTFLNDVELNHKLLPDIHNIIVNDIMNKHQIKYTTNHNNVLNIICDNYTFTFGDDELIINRTSSDIIIKYVDYSIEKLYVVLDARDE